MSCHSGGGGRLGYHRGRGSEMNLSGEEGSPSPVLAAGQAEGPRLIFGREPQVTAALRPGLGPAPSGWGEAKALVRTAQSGTSSHSGQGWGPLQATTNLWLKTPLKRALKEGGRVGVRCAGGWSAPEGACALGGPAQDARPSSARRRAWGRGESPTRGGPQAPSLRPSPSPRQLSTRGAAGSPRRARRSG